jgi:hypothetical protein
MENSDQRQLCLFDDLHSFTNVFEIFGAFSRTKRPCFLAGKASPQIPHDLNDFLAELLLFPFKDIEKPVKLLLGR